MATRCTLPAAIAVDALSKMIKAVAAVLKYWSLLILPKIFLVCVLRLSELPEDVKPVMQ